MLMSLIDIIVVFGQRNIPFRGYKWNKQTKREDANFNFFAHWKAEFHPVLKEHLQQKHFIQCSRNIATMQ